MARRKTRLNLHIDSRCNNLTDAALFCRRNGHKWADKAITRSRFQELIRNGHQEDNRYCENGCGATWRQLWDVHTGEILETDRKYPTGGEYLMPPNTGRLSRQDARVAYFARQYPSYA